VGILVPADFPMDLLANDAERVVVRTLCDRLTDGWVVIPDIGLHSLQRDRQMDIVIAHARDGIAVIEVKGHVPMVRSGVFYANGVPMKPQPLAQAKDNAYELRARLRRLLPHLPYLGVEYGVAFPNAGEIDGQLPPDVHRAQVFTRSDLDDPMDAVDRLAASRHHVHELGDDGVAAVVADLRPDADFKWDPDARARHARQRLDEICAEQVRALETLDLNRRVCVTGGAGTGKTRLAVGWARRAASRGERVLLVCFNRPLASDLQDRLDELAITVGTFHDTARFLDGMPEIDVPDDADGTWWDTVMLGHLHSNWHLIADRFDTVVVDEAQDFSPAWLTMLDQLLDPAGPRRMLMVADESQVLYRRGFTVPSPGDGWTRCELNSNCRNTFQIASILRRGFAGPIAPIGGPQSEAVIWVDVDDAEAAVAEVGEAIDVVTDEADHSPASILVATTSSAMREQLIDDYAFVRWEDRDETTIVCETVHRVKGLEFDHVVLVTPDADVTDDLLYVGISRAVVSLTVVAPSAVAERLGLMVTSSE
jgi:hypothetical protein